MKCWNVSKASGPFSLTVQKFLMNFSLLLTSIKCRIFNVTKDNNNQGNYEQIMGTDFT